MTIEALGNVAASAAGTPLAHSTGSDVAAAQLATIAAARSAEADERADRAAGIAQPDGDDLESSDRDASGLRLLDTSTAKTVRTDESRRTDARPRGDRRARAHARPVDLKSRRSAQRVAAGDRLPNDAHSRAGRIAA